MKFIPPKYTGGTWSVGEKHPGRIIGNGKVIGYACQFPDDDADPTEEEKANALLMADAPRMKSILESLAFCIRNGGIRKPQESADDIEDLLRDAQGERE